MGKKGSKGLTLVEIIVAFAIIGIISVTFFTIFGGAYKGIGRGEARSKAVFEAQNKIEEYLAGGELNGASVGASASILDKDGGEISVDGTLITVELVFSEQYEGDWTQDDSLIIFMPDKQ